MKIEAGKFYRNRRGERVGPMTTHDSRKYPWFARSHASTFTIDGRLFAGDECAGDLIAEWHDETHDSGELPKSAGFGDGYFTHVGVDLASGPDQTVISRTILLSWPDTAAPAYAPLAAILQEAYDQAASGKGHERHAAGLPFERQPMLEIGRRCGLGFDTGQATKKIQEAMGMLERGEDDAAIRELLGAINYAAAAVILIRERKRA